MFGYMMLVIICLQCYNPSLPLARSKMEPKWLHFYCNYADFLVFMQIVRFRENVPTFMTYMKIFIPVFMLFSSTLWYSFAGMLIPNESRISFRSGASISMKRYRSPFHLLRSSCILCPLSPVLHLVKINERLNLCGI